MKYSPSTRELQRMKPKGSGYISPHILTQVTIQTFSITSTGLILSRICPVQLSQYGRSLYWNSSACQIFSLSWEYDKNIRPAEEFVVAPFTLIGK